MDRLAHLWHRTRRLVLRRRRLLAFLLTLAAVAATLDALAPPEAPSEPVLVAAASLPSGHVLTTSDLRTVRYARGTAPARGLTRAGARGRTLSSPVTPGTPLTNVDVLGPGLLATSPGRVAAPVRLPDADAAALLRVGDRVDLVAADPSARSEAVVVSRAVSVLSTPRPGGDVGDPGLAPGRLVVLAVPASDAGDVLTAAVGGYLTFTLSR